jgi:hypothetical protein
MTHTEYFRRAVERYAELEGCSFENALWNVPLYALTDRLMDAGEEQLATFSKVRPAQRWVDFTNLLTDALCEFLGGTVKFNWVTSPSVLQLEWSWPTETVNSQLRVAFRRGEQAQFRSRSAHMFVSGLPEGRDFLDEVAALGGDARDAWSLTVHSSSPPDRPSAHN